MRKLFRIWPALSAMTIALPGAAGAQDSSAFDARYAGVSIVGTGTGTCRPASPPRPLRIRDGQALLLMGPQAELVFAGAVRTDGSFILKDDAGTRMTGNIDAMGAVTASMIDGATGCAYTLSWRYE